MPLDTPSISVFMHPCTYNSFATPQRKSGYATVECVALKKLVVAGV